MTQLGNICGTALSETKKKSHLCHSDKNNKKYFFVFPHQDNSGGTGQQFHYTIWIYMAGYSNYLGDYTGKFLLLLIKGPPFSAEIEVLKNMISCNYSRNFTTPIIVWKTYPKLYRKQIICKFFWQEILFIKKRIKRETATPSAPSDKNKPRTIIIFLLSPGEINNYPVNRVSQGQRVHNRGYITVRMEYFIHKKCTSIIKCTRFAQFFIPLLSPPKSYVITLISFITPMPPAYPEFSSSH